MQVCLFENLTSHQLFPLDNQDSEHFLKPKYPNDNEKFILSKFSGSFSDNSKTMKQIRDKNSKKMKIQKEKVSQDRINNDEYLTNQAINFQQKRIKKVYSREDLNSDEYLTSNSINKLSYSSRIGDHNNVISRNQLIKKSNSELNQPKMNYGSIIPSTINCLK